MDLDILVHEEQVDRAVRILEAEDFHCENQGLELTARQRQYVRTSIHHFEFIHGRSGLHVELHWNVGPWLPGQMRVILRHTTSREWQGIPVTCLDDDANLLVLCDHGSRHEWSSLKWLGDVARLFVSDRPEGWDRLIALAHEIDLQRVLAHSALLVHWVYGIRLPSEICTLIRQESQASSLSERALAVLQMSRSELTFAERRWQMLRNILQMKRLRPSVPYSLLLKAWLLSLDDFKVLRLPDSWFWLYYPLRPILWLWRYAFVPQKRA